MTHYEMVELLREKANVSYEEAKEALEAADWDLLDAIVLLEKEGKTQKTTAAYTTEDEEEEVAANRSGRKHRAREKASRLGNWICRLIKLGNRNFLVVYKGDKELFELSATSLVLALIPYLPLTLILLVSGMFMGLRYRFRGEELGKDAVNSAINKAGKVVDNVKNSFNAEDTETKEEE